MEPNLKISLLDHIGHIYENASKCKLEPAFFEQSDKDLTIVANYLGVTKSQALFVSMIFALNYMGDTVDINDMIEYFGCNPVTILKYSHDFTVLTEVGILIKEKSRHRVKVALNNDQFIVNEKVTDAILHNKPLPDLNRAEHNDVIELLEHIYLLSQKRDDEDISTQKLLNDTTQLIESNLRFPLIKYINLAPIGTTEKLIFLIVVWKSLTGNISHNASRIIEEIFDNPAKRVKYMQDISSGNNLLMENDLIEIVDSGFINDSEFQLTNKSLQIIEECNIALLKIRKNKSIIAPALIEIKPLFYNEEDKPQINTLAKLLMDDEFSAMQKRLKEKKLPSGITVLLHGKPGTGKTETVYQLAASCEREIMKVDISQTKSMWFGESEKIIKKIFADYRSYATRSKSIPFLLFNEADAIISKRMELKGSHLSKTENTIQNIILEELENFDGIFFATTNLVTNLDSAFERRFLFKIKLNVPEKPVKKMIWEEKLSNLSEKEYLELVEEFDFTGGQIDNIVRKAEIYFIINGETPNFSKIYEYCQDEKLNPDKVKPIGFNN